MPWAVPASPRGSSRLRTPQQPEMRLSWCGAGGGVGAAGWDPPEPPSLGLPGRRVSLPPTLLLRPRLCRPQPMLTEKGIFDWVKKFATAGSECARQLPVHERGQPVFLQMRFWVRVLAAPRSRPAWAGVQGHQLRPPAASVGPQGAMAPPRPQPLPGCRAKDAAPAPLSRPCPCCPGAPNPKCCRGAR